MSWPSASEMYLKLSLKTCRNSAALYILSGRLTENPVMFIEGKSLSKAAALLVVLWKITASYKNKQACKLFQGAHIVLLWYTWDLMQTSFQQTDKPSSCLPLIEIHFCGKSQAYLLLFDNSNQNNLVKIVNLQWKDKPSKYLIEIQQEITSLPAVTDETESKTTAWFKEKKW